MKTRQFKKTTLSVTLSSALMVYGAMAAMAAKAEDAPVAAAPASKVTGALGAIVVTATADQKSKLESSLSVTDVSSELVEALAPTSQAEVLRLIPGIIPSQGSPGGNANIAVRGLPVPTGGGTFVQLQEDGLPTVLFGDMQFGNNDYWIRFDRSNTIQAVRGGSASTLASQAPGAVINYISDTGLTKGGEISVSAGLNYDEQKVDFAYGGPLAEGWRFHVDGFLKQGRGLQDEGFQAEKGYQIKANVTHDLEGGRGYIRGYLKLLDDKGPYQQATPLQYSSNGGTITNTSNLGGYNAGTFATVGPASRYFNIANVANGQISQVEASGIHPVAQAIGAELHYLANGGLVIDDKARFTTMSGEFSTYFGNYNPASSFIGSAIGGANGSGKTVTGFVYNNGALVDPNTPLTNNVQVYTHVTDAGSFANDLSVSKKFTVLGKDDLSTRAGVFYMDQKYVADWHPNYSFLTFGPNSVPVNPVSTSGATSTLLALNGVSGYNSNWGAGVARQFNLDEADYAPYLSLNWDKGNLSLDGSVRRDIARVSGYTETGSSATLTQLTGNTVLGGTTYPYQVGLATLDPSTYQPADIGISYNSWSLGALYLLNDSNSVFARASRGGRAGFDRLVPSGNVNPLNGSYDSRAAANLVSIVLQQEVGVKTEGDFAEGKYGKYSAEFTIFHDSFANANSDLTVCGPAGAPNDCGKIVNNQYSARGFEFDGTYNYAGFGLTTQLTYSNANVDSGTTCFPVSGCTSSGSGYQPGSVPSVTYMVAPTYRYGPYYGGLVITGANATPVTVGTSNVWLEPYTLVSLVGSYAIDPSTIFTLHVNNLFNSLAVTYINGLGTSPVNNQAATGVTAYGRTVQGSLTFKF